MKSDPDAAVVHEALQAMVRAWTRVAGLFCGQGLALGAHLTLADCAMAPFSTIMSLLAERFEAPSQGDGGARLAEWIAATAELDVCQVTDARIRSAFAQIFKAAA